jgi:hypothetical protein
MIGAKGAASPGGAERLLRVHRSRPAAGMAYWRWHCRFCGEYGGGHDHPDTLSRAMRHCAEHPHHPSSLVPGSRCAQVWPLPVPVPEAATGPAGDAPSETAIYDRLVAAQQYPMIGPLSRTGPVRKT